MASVKKSSRHSGVYPAKNIGRDINGGSIKIPAHTRLQLIDDPIDDLIARALAEGLLTARNSAGRQIATPTVLGDFRNVYVAPDEVNQVLAQAKYLERWAPKPVPPRRPKRETPAE